MSNLNPVNITQIDHVVLRVNNLAKMVDFYCDVLGFRLERGPGDSGLAQLRAGASLLDLVDVNSPLGREGGRAPDHDASNVDHICFLVMPWDAEAVLAQLQKHGVKHGEIASRYGATGQGPSVYCTDPEGNNIELKGAP